MENLIISYVLEHCLAQLFESWFLKRFVKYVNWHVISIVLCLLLGGFGGMPPKKIFKNGAISCVLRAIFNHFHGKKTLKKL